MSEKENYLEPRVVYYTTKLEWPLSCVEVYKVIFKEHVQDRKRETCLIISGPECFGENEKFSFSLLM